MDFQKWYNQSEFKKFLKLNLLKDSFEEINEQLPPVRKTQFFVENEIYKIGEIKGFEKEVSILQIKQKSKNDPRITLTKDTFKLMQDYSIRNALIVFWTDDNSPWRFSLLTTNFTEDFKKELSSPKRYSYILWPGEKIKTPERYLIKDWVVKNFEDLLSRFDVEVVRKEFFKLYVNLFLELYGEIQDNPTFHVLIQQKKIEPVSFAKNLMGKMIFLYFIQKKWWLWIADKSTSFGNGDSDFFKNNFDKLAHDADLFQKHSNFYNDFLEPLFYSGLNKKNPDDWHSTLNMKVPYLNGWLFEEEYDWKSTIIELNNQVFKNIITSFDTYNFTIDEDDPIDREIAVDPEMLGKIFESMISVSKDNIDDIMDVYRKAKEQKHIIHPNPENILNIDIGKEINKKFWAFYTPREIVHYMTKESLIVYLTNKLHENNQSQSEEEIESIVRKLFDYKDKHLTKQEIESEKLDGYELVKKYVFDIQEALKSVKILDPAVGSWAFPMWILQEVLWLRRYLIDTFHLENESDFDIKKQIVQNSIHGVDIDPGAVDIARLRFRLSLIVDATEPVPLPNLDFKFVCANTLIPLEEWGLFVNEKLINELKDLRFRYFACSNFEEKETLKKEFKKIKESFFLMDRDKLQGLKGKDWRITKSYTKAIEEFAQGAVDKKNKQILERDPFDTSKSNEWFDGQMIFGLDSFDVIIWNPPYLKERGNAKFFDPVNKSSFGKKYHQGKMDFWYYFLHKGIDLVNKNWYIFFITNSYWLKSDGSSKLIDRIQKTLTIDKLVDFHDFPIFQEVSGKHMLHWYVKKNMNDDDMTLYIGITKDDFDEMIIDNNKWIKLKANELIKNQKIHIQTSNDLFEWKDLLNLGNIYDVSQGVVEASDKISRKSFQKIWWNHLVWDWIFVLSESELRNLSLSNMEEKIVKKYLDTHDVLKYAIGASHEYLLYTNKEAICNIANGEFKNIKKHLDNVNLFITSSNKPYWIHRPREQRFFESPKLICKWMFKSPEFTYDADKYYVWMSFSVIIQKDSNYDLKYLLAILNSKLGAYRFNKNWKKRWVGVDIGVQVFRQFPVKKVSIDEQKIFVNIVDQILAKKKENPKADTVDLERQIDQMVYELYDLTDEEIKIVEGN